LILGRADRPDLERAARDSYRFAVSTDLVDQSLQLGGKSILRADGLSGAVGSNGPIVDTA
jgi:hypothetical protein